MPTTLQWTDRDNALIREALAAYAHDAWSGWMQYMIPILQPILRVSEWEHTPEGAEAKRHLTRWLRQMQTGYADLSEDEQESDRREAEKILEVFRQVGATLTVTYEPIKLEGAFDGEPT